MVDRNPDSQEAPPRIAIRGACRRLDFGDEKDDNQPTKEELDRQFQEEMAKELEKKKKKWNFDFTNGKPLEGRYQWEEIDQRGEACNGAPASADAPADRP